MAPSTRNVVRNDIACTLGFHVTSSAESWRLIGCGLAGDKLGFRCHLHRATSIITSLSHLCKTPFLAVDSFVRPLSTFFSVFRFYSILDAVFTPFPPIRPVSSKPNIPCGLRWPWAPGFFRNPTPSIRRVAFEATERRNISHLSIKQRHTQPEQRTL